jgi:hypothetical protein
MIVIVKNNVVERNIRMIKMEKMKIFLTAKAEGILIRRPQKLFMANPISKTFRFFKRLLDEIDSV